MNGRHLARPGEIEAGKGLHAEQVNQYRAHERGRDGKHTEQDAGFIRIDLRSGSLGCGEVGS